MVLNFCPHCNNLLIPKLGAGEKFVFCAKCGYFKEVSKYLVTKEKVGLDKKAEGIVKDENIYATYEHECEKCGWKKAQIIDMGVFVSDEDNLIFIKCGKCGYVERIGRRTS